MGKDRPYKAGWCTFLMMHPNRLISLCLYGKKRDQRVRREKPPKDRDSKAKGRFRRRRRLCQLLGDFLVVDALISRRFLKRSHTGKSMSCMRSRCYHSFGSIFCRHILAHYRAAGTWTVVFSKVLLFLKAVLKSKNDISALICY